MISSIMLPSSSWPVPFLMARSMVSLGQEASRASAMAIFRRELELGSAPPRRAATAISRANLVNIAPFFCAASNLPAFFQPLPIVQPPDREEEMIAPQTPLTQANVWEKL